MDLWDFLVEVRADGRREGRKPLPPPGFLLGLFQGLPPGSMTEAALNDSPGETGWTVEAHLLASASDWAQVGAISGGNWKNKAPDFKPVTRPFEAIKKKKSAADKQKRSVAEIHRMLQEKRLAQGG